MAAKPGSISNGRIPISVAGFQRLRSASTPWPSLDSARRGAGHSSARHVGVDGGGDERVRRAWNICRPRGDRRRDLECVLRRPPARSPLGTRSMKIEDAHCGSALAGLHRTSSSRGTRGGSRTSRRISLSVSPAARGSRTSVTRIRVPRMHGRPAHWTGFTVIRWRSSSLMVVTSLRYQGSAPRYNPGQSVPDLLATAARSARAARGAAA